MPILYGHNGGYADKGIVCCREYIHVSVIHVSPFFCVVPPSCQFREQDLQLRTKEIYDAHCRGLDGPLRSHIATTYGVANNSVLNKCQYFHVVNGLVPDIMHDILEG